MLLNIILQNEGPTSLEVYDKLSAPIHKSLAGNKDYIESNIVLNIDEKMGIPTCTLYIDANKCKDKEYVRNKTKEAIDLFIDSL